MAQDEASVAVAERPQEAVEIIEPAGPPAAVEKGKKRKKKQKDEEPEYELGFDTPFGAIEFEIEPASSKELRDKRKREKAERDAAKAEARAAKKAERQLAKGAPVGGRRGTLLAALIIFAVVASLVAIAIWLFASPGPKEQDEIPEEYLQPGVEPVAEPESLGQRVRARLRHAVRAGRQASREAQQEQERRFKDLTRGR
jgi:hypothetical protein